LHWAIFLMGIPSQRLKAWNMTIEQQDDAKTFWDNLAWEVYCFPERFSPLQQQHIEAGLDPRDLEHLSEEPRLKGRPTQYCINGRCYSID
jgi:hypothetical protein